jgi:hypothetical protein
MKRIYLVPVAILTILAGCATMEQNDRCPGTALSDLSSQIDAARSFLIKKNAAAHYKTDAPILMKSSANLPREKLLAFPLKTQHPTAIAKGWTEIGIVFGFLPEGGDPSVVHFPNEMGYKYFVVVDKDGQAVQEKTGIREYGKLEDPNKPLEATR